MASVSREVNRLHNSLLIKLCEKMDPNDMTYKNFIICLRSYIPEGMLSSVHQTPADVFLLMEKRGILKAGEYRDLKEALMDSGYINVLDFVKKEEEYIVRQMRKRSYSDGPMACGSSNIDAATVSSIEPEEPATVSSIKPEVIEEKPESRDTEESNYGSTQRNDDQSDHKRQSRAWEIYQMEFPNETEIDLLLDLQGFCEQNAIKFAENIFSNCYKDGNAIRQFVKDLLGINKLRDDLIKAYRNLRCAQVSPVFEKMRCDIDSIFVDIVIEEEQESRNVEEESKYVTQLENAQPHSKKIIKVTSYKQVFLDERGLKFTRVYLRGKGGLGKTTFCRKVLHAWCNAHENKVTNHDSFFQDEAVLQTFDLLFYLNLREVSEEKTLIEVICTQFPLEDSPDKNVLGTLLKANGDKVLFILDGLDEVIVKPMFLENIVRRRVYPNCCFLVSSRPWKISQMALHEGTEIDLLLDLKGFNKENAIKCAKKIFENCFDNGNAIEIFLKDIEGNKLVTQLIHVPLVLLILTQVWYENNRSLPCKLHELYILFLNLLTNRVKEKYQKDPNHRQMRFTLGDMRSPLPSKISETSLVVNFGEGLFLSLCEVAHHFLLSSQKENSLVFEETKLLNVLGDRGEEKKKIALDLGVLSMTDSVSYICRKMNVSFLHKTFQEFFTALCFIVSQDKLANFVSSIADLNDVQQYENIIVFLVGLKPELGNSVLEKVNELCKEDWEEFKKNELMNEGRSDMFYPISDYIFIPPIDGLCGISNIYLRCNNEMMGENVLLNVSGLVLKQKVFNPHPWNPAFLQSLILDGSMFTHSTVMGTNSTDSSLLDLRGLTGLGYLRLEHLTCELYLPESGSLSILIMIILRLSSCCCDVLGRTLTCCTRLEKLCIHDTNLHNCLLDLSNMTKLTVLHMSMVTLSSSCCNVIGSTLTHCTKLKILKICKIDHNCVLDLSNMTELTSLVMSEVTLSSSCCDVLGSTLSHFTKLENLAIHNTDLHNCVLDLSNMTELTHLDMSEVTLSSSCCDVLGRTLTHCTELRILKICNIDLQNCILDLSNMTELTRLDMSEVTLSSSCCDVLGSTLTHCTKLKILKICKIDLHNCVLDLSNMTELLWLGISEVTLSSSCCDVLGSTLTHCTKLKGLKICKIDHNCVLDLSNMTELTSLVMSEVTLSSSCCDVLGSTLSHFTKLENLAIHNTDLHNCVLDLSNMTELTHLDMSEVTLSSSCCDVLGRTLTHCTELRILKICNIDLQNCILDLSNMTELTRLDMSEVTLSSSCCDVLGSTLTHCTKLKILKICKIDLHNCVLDLSNMTELLWLGISEVTLSSSCCDVLGSTLTHCTKLKGLKICKIDHNCVLDLSNMTELTSLVMSEVTLSSSCCDVLGSTLSHFTKLENLAIHNTDLHNCVLDLSNMTELTHLDMSEVTLSSSCCDVLGRTLTHCTELRILKICNIDLQNCILDLSNMTELTRLDMSEVTLSSSCCDVLGSTLTHCTKLENLAIHNTDLHNCVLDLSNMTELTHLDMSKVTLSSSCCDVLGSTLTLCTKLNELKICKIDLHNCVLDLSNMTELLWLGISEVTLSSSCCDVLGSTLTHCTKLKILKICKIDLHNCVLDLSNMTELAHLDMSEVTLSSSCCDVLGRTLTHCTMLEFVSIKNTDLHNCVLDLSKQQGDFEIS